MDSGNNRGWRYDQVTEAGPSGSAGGGGLSSSSKSRQSSNSSPSNIIQQIQDRIAELRRQLHELQGEGASDFALYRTLLRGMQGEDVRYLQTLLNKLGFPVASSGPGSTGNETSLFGQLTHDAVVKLQAAHIAEILTPAGLSAPTGIVGPATRAWLQNNQ
ncbi:MAG: peptidoglycan-binding domain-containing protein [Candidatus Paceibacterota bacterium]